MENGLSAASLTMLGDRLEQLERDLSDLLTTTESDAQPTPLKENASRLSRMDEMHNQSILRANRIVTKNRLIEVRKARVRLAEKDYGICLDCLEDIAREAGHTVTLRDQKAEHSCVESRTPQSWQEKRVRVGRSKSKSHIRLGGSSLRCRKAGLTRLACGRGSRSSRSLRAAACGSV